MTQSKQITSFATEYLRINLDSTGCVTSIYDITHDKEYSASKQAVPLLRIIIDDAIHDPEDMVYDTEKHLLKLTYGTIGVVVHISVDIKPTHLTFSLNSVQGDNVGLVMWGPYPTTIGQIIGETVGVVRNDHFAFGIQALTIQTIGGRPREYAQLKVGDETHAASSTEYGSVVQAYTRDSDGGIIGSKIALFGCPSEDALDFIGQIEVLEGLPHPMLDGEWGKKSDTARLSYLITEFGEHNIEEVLGYAQKAGFRYIYHSGPFQDWGHFHLSPRDFPDGDESLRRCVAKAEQSGIRVGVHTLSNFITTNDPYVSSVPDSRLMCSGSSRTIKAVDESSTEIAVDDPAPFREQGILSTVIIGTELIQYRTVSDSEPWTLLDCKRGAFGTKASYYPENIKIGKLVDHPYRVFFPNLEMQDEMARRLVELFNKTGLRQISFDGLEGCERTGHGIYAHNRFVQQCFDGWEMEVINDASRLLHYLWHIHTRMNWGEPWGKATREGMPEYRFKNQDYFNRNLFPRMLGWFQLRLASDDVEATSVDDIEWVLSKCAGFDAGFALSTGLMALKRNGQTEAILKAIKEWEKARIECAFSQDQRERLKDPNGEFHLESIGDNRWQLYPVAYSPVFSYSLEERQPGEPTEAEWEFENSFSEQPMRFVMQVISGVGLSREDAVINPCFEVGFHQITFPVRLLPYQYLICNGDELIKIYDTNWNELESLKVTSKLPTIPTGKQRIRFHCDGRAGHRIEARFKTIGEPDIVGYK